MDISEPELVHQLLVRPIWTLSSGFFPLMPAFSPGTVISWVVVAPHAAGSEPVAPGRMPGHSIGSVAPVSTRARQGWPLSRQFKYSPFEWPVWPTSVHKPWRRGDEGWSGVPLTELLCCRFPLVGLGFRCWSWTIAGRDQASHTGSSSWLTGHHLDDGELPYPFSHRCYGSSSGMPALLLLSLRACRHTQSLVLPLLWHVSGSSWGTGCGWPAPCSSRLSCSGIPGSWSGSTIQFLPRHPWRSTVAPLSRSQGTDRFIRTLGISLPSPIRAIGISLFGHAPPCSSWVIRSLMSPGVVIIFSSLTCH